MPITDAWFFRIKAAQKDLIERCGGIVRSGEKCSTSKTEVGRWSNPTDPDIMPIPAALQLEADCNVPIVTTVMAELNRRRLTDPDDSGAMVGNAALRHADAMVGAAELMSAGALAFADNRLTPAEAAKLDRVASTLERAVADFRQSLAAVRASGGLTIVSAA